MVDFKNLLDIHCDLLILLIERSFNEMHMTLKQLDKRSAILRGTLELIAERGFHDTPMSKIAKNAGVSAGIIYHYFEDKDDLIHALYDDVAERFADALIQQNVIDLPFPQNIEQVWMNAFRYYVENPTEALFLEQYKSSPYGVTLHSETAFDDKNFDILLQMLKVGMDAGMIHNLHPMVIYTMTLGVAAQIAKYHINGMLKMSDEELQKTAKLCTQSIRV